VRELKAQLSAYLERVKAGETITVTDRGVPVAEIRPVGAVRVLEELIAQGLVSRATGTGELPKRRIKPKGSVVELLLEDRHR
jgi:prevent-host-death family protein